MSQSALKTFITWLPLAIAITGLAGLIYLAVQQDLRLSANDPQIQLAQDIAAALVNGQQPQTFDRPTKQEMGKSLAQFLLIFDENGNVVASTVQLNGQPLKLPSGVFEAAKTHGENRVTWQPATNLREATVIEPAFGQQRYYVVVGRSLKEIEIREAMLLRNVLAAWFLTLIATFIATAVLVPLRRLASL